jgi:hypothetical protein
MSESLNLYYDHYKDTFEQVKSHIRNRDEAFILSIIAFSASLFTSLNPTYFLDLSTSISKVKFGIDLNLAFYTLNSLLILISTWFLIRYYASVITIENLYTYLHRTEDTLSAAMGDFKITREGKSYLLHYPCLKSGLHFFYQFIFPMAVIFVSGFKGYWEITRRSKVIPLGALIFDITCLLLLVVLTGMYLSWIYFGDFKKKAKA